MELFEKRLIASSMNGDQLTVPDPVD
jgi:hypothetical protein